MNPAYIQAGLAAASAASGKGGSGGGGSSGSPQLPPDIITATSRAGGDQQFSSQLKAWTSEGDRVYSSSPVFGNNPFLSTGGIGGANFTVLGFGALILVGLIVYLKMR